MMPSIRDIMDVALKDWLKEIFKFIILLLVISGLACWAFLGGQAYEDSMIDAYFEDRCGEVPRYHKAGSGIEVYYVETKMDSDCNETDKPQLWTVPKKGGDE